MQDEIAFRRSPLATAGITASLAPLRLPAHAAGVERGEIVAPAPVVFEAELIEVVPGVNASVMQIVEPDADGVIPDRLERHDADMPAASDNRLLAWPMALHLG